MLILKMKKISVYIVLILFTISCKKTPEISNSEVTDLLSNYKPEMVAPGVISTSFFEGHASICPDGDEMYFAIYNNDHSYSTIAFSKKKGNVWQKPEIVSFSGNYNDGSPALSPDGTQLFFSSNRPITGKELNSSHDIWMVNRTDNGWSNPIHLKSVNSAGYDFSPSVDSDGNLYFCSRREGGYGDLDVYVSYNNNSAYKDPILLDTNINSKYHEGNVGVSPDGNLLFVMVQHKPGDFGYDDIHYSVKKNGTWIPLKNLGEVVNTYTYDFSPKVSPDGNTLYFSSRLNKDFINKDTRNTYKSLSTQLNSPLNGFGNIYKISLNQLGLK